MVGHGFKISYLVGACPSGDGCVVGSTGGHRLWLLSSRPWKWGPRMGPLGHPWRWMGAL